MWTREGVFLKIHCNVLNVLLSISCQLTSQLLFILLRELENKIIYMQKYVLMIVRSIVRWLNHKVLGNLNGSGKVMIRYKSVSNHPSSRYHAWVWKVVRPFSSYNHNILLVLSSHYHHPVNNHLLHALGEAGIVLILRWLILERTTAMKIHVPQYCIVKCSQNYPLSIPHTCLIDQPNRLFLSWDTDTAPLYCFP